MSTKTAPAEPARYTRTAIALHWLIAGFIISAFALGWIMTEMAISPLKLRMFNWHKWVGVTVLGLAAIRSLWRLTHTAPALLPMPAWQRNSAHTLHGLLYLAMFAIPLSGWAYSNASGYPVVYLGLLPLPTFIDKNRELAQSLREIHELFGWVLVVLVTIHIVAALKHHFFDRDDTLRRMLPRRH
ncbi:MAG: cytochrome b [Steroidobacteraceae bacterium]